MIPFLGEVTQTPASGVLDTIRDTAIIQYLESIFLFCFNLVVNESLYFN